MSGDPVLLEWDPPRHPHLDRFLAPQLKVAVLRAVDRLRRHRPEVTVVRVKWDRALQQLDAVEVVR